MKRNIPEQLQDTSFRFFLISRNKKTPIQQKWNSDNSKMFFEPDLLKHIKRKGNIGICTGHGGLIVIDFDSRPYQEIKARMMPKTFTVITATKKLRHYYYRLKGEMFRKIGIGIDPRLCDIQAAGSGVVCPPSVINLRLYSVIDESPIADITSEQLQAIFGINGFRTPRERAIKGEIKSEQIQSTIDLLLKLGVKRTKERHFKCPFHMMSGDGNLWVDNQGELYCFHCQRYWKSAEHFRFEWEQLQGGITLVI